MKGRGAAGWLGPAGLVASIATAGLLIAAACRVPQEEPPPATPARPRPPGLYFQDFRLSGRERGERQWELEVAAAEAPEGREEVGFRVVRRGTVFRDGRPYLFLAADGGTYRPARNEFTLQGHVVVSRPNGDLLRTSALRWDPVARRATSEGPVEAKVEGIWFRADRLTVDVDAEAVTAAGRVELTLPLGEKDETCVAPGLGGGDLSQPAQGGARR